MVGKKVFFLVQQFSLVEHSIIRQNYAWIIEYFVELNVYSFIHSFLFMPFSKLIVHFTSNSNLCKFCFQAFGKTFTKVAKYIEVRNEEGEFNDKNSDEKK